MAKWLASRKMVVYSAYEVEASSRKEAQRIIDEKGTACGEVEFCYEDIVSSSKLRVTRKIR